MTMGLCALCALAMAGCAADRTPAATQAPVLATQSPMISAAPSPESGDMLKDGTYTAKSSAAYAAENDGWEEYVTLTVQGGKVTKVEFDALKDGKKKSETTREEYPMDPPPSEWMPEIAKRLEGMKENGSIDVVAGATRSSRMAERLYGAAWTAARNGEPREVTLADDLHTAMPTDEGADGQS